MQICRRKSFHFFHVCPRGGNCPMDGDHSRDDDCPGVVTNLEQMIIKVIGQLWIEPSIRFKELYPMFVYKIWDKQTDRQYCIWSCSATKNQQNQKLTTTTNLTH